MATTRITDLPTLSLLTDDDTFLVTNGVASTNAMTYADLRANIVTSLEATNLSLSGDVSFLGTLSGLATGTLSDINFTNPVTGDYVTYDGNEWVNTQFDLGVYSIGSLSDVNIPGANDGQILAWDQANSYWTHVDVSSVAVSSVFGRSGDVTAQIGDYSSVQISNDSNVVGASVRDALNTLNPACLLYTSPSPRDRG